MYVWPYSPHWENPLNLTYAFDTRVILSRTGVERRQSNRFRPRIKVAYTAARDGDDGRDMREALHTRMQEDVLVPFWTEGQQVVDVVGGGKRIIVFNEFCRFGDDFVYYFTNGTDTFIGRIVRIYNNDPDLCRYDLRELDSNAPPSGRVKAGMWAYPCLPARFAPQETYQMHTSILSESPVIFEDIPGTYTQPAVGAPVFAPIGESEVFEFPINWTRPPDTKIDANRITIDNGRGSPFVDYPKPYVSEIKKIQLLFNTPQDIAAFVDFFIRHRGRAKSFLFPSQESDFTFERANPRDNNIILRGANFKRLFELPSTASGVSFMQAGEEQIAGVRRKPYHHALVKTPQATADETTYLVLRSALPADFPDDLTKFARGSILYTARFASDSLVVSYITPSVARIEVEIQTIPNES